MADLGSYSLPSPLPPRPLEGAAARPERVRFGPFEADLRSLELWRGGAPVKLQPQPFRLLAALLRRPGQLVTREELRREVWGDHTAVDFEHGLNFCVKQARIALGDSAEHPEFIETLPRRGYRFVARVEECRTVGLAEPEPARTQESPTVLRPEAAAPAPVSPMPDEAPDAERAAVVSPRRRTGPRVTAAAGALVVVAAAATAVLRPRAPSAAPGPPSAAVLVVLPFANLTGDPARDALSDAVTDDTIHALASLDPARVAVLAPTTSLALRGRPRADVARELGVDYALEGSLRAEGGHGDHADCLSVRAALVRTRDGHVVWGETLDAGDGDVAAAEHRLGVAIAEALVAKLDDGPLRPTTRAADEALHKARYLARKRGPGAAAPAIAAYEEAVRIDGANADALAELSLLYVDAVGTMPLSEAMARAHATAERAVATSPQSALAHVARGMSALQADWDWAAADASLARAVALRPGLATAHHLRAAFLSAAGRHAEALASIARAQALDPLSTAVVSDAGWHAYLARDYVGAARELARSLDLEPDDAWTREHLMNARLRAGDGEGARAEAIVLAERLAGGEGDARSLRMLPPEGAVREVSHRIASARTARLASAPGTGGPFLAATLAAAGEDDAALDVLERATASKAPWLLPALRDPRFDRLRDQPRFAALVARVRLPVATPLTAFPR